MIPDDIWTDGIDSLRRECRSEHLVGSVLQEVVTRDKIDDFFPGCRLFRIDSELVQGNDRGAIQRFYVLRPDDARPYQLHRDQDVIALARAEHVKLTTARAAFDFAGFAVGLVLDEERLPERHGEAWVVAGSTDRADEPLAEHVLLRLDEQEKLVDVIRVGQAFADECGPTPTTGTNLVG